MDLPDLDPCCFGSIFKLNSKKFTRVILMTLSNVFMMWLVRLIGLKFTVSALDPPLWIGVINASFSILGISPVFDELLKSLHISLEIGILACFSMIAGIPSGPQEAPFGMACIASLNSLSQI